MDDLTQQEQALLAEVEGGDGVVFIHSRQSGNQTEEDKARLHGLKALVYKNLIAYDANFNKKQFVFISRKKFPLYP